MSEENKVDANLEEQTAQSTETPAKETNAEALDQLTQQVEKWKNDYLYLRAEFETYKRNAIKERADLSKYGSERLVNEILAVVDNFDRALSIVPTSETLEVYSQGVKMTAGELKSVLTRFGVVEVKSEGAAFDPNLHEALGTEETDAFPEGHISKVYRSAYKLHDRLIRPAQVVVAKSKVASKPN